MTMKMDIRKAAAAVLIGSSALFGGINQVRAEVDYEGIKYLGGGDKIDLNNANIRAYLKLPGLYPSIAGKIVSNPTPYKSVGDVYNTPGLTSAEKDVLKKQEPAFSRGGNNRIICTPLHSWLFCIDDWFALMMYLH